MSRIHLKSRVEELPQAWKSQVISRIGSAQIKILRMDACELVEERHPYTEALLVIEGVMNLVIGEKSIPVNPGEVYIVPAGQPHSVGPGSHGCLVIIDEPEEEHADV